MILAQITDLHVRSPKVPAIYPFDINALLRKAVGTLGAFEPKPDAVIVTGDLVDCGREDEYELLLEILKPIQVPVYLIPGNHDERETFRKVLRPHHAYLPKEGFIQYVVEDYPLRLVALDTTVAGSDGGMLCEARLDWLEARLNEAKDRPTVVFMHHPPIRTWMPEMDSLRCANGDKLRALLRGHPQVQRVTCGHVHRPVQVHWEHAIVNVAPSAVHQLHLDFTPEQLVRYTLEPAGFHVHLWDAEEGIITHMAHVGDFPGPFDFHTTARADHRGELR